jgi:hypothetical protein
MRPISASFHVLRMLVISFLACSCLAARSSGESGDGVAAADGGAIWAVAEGAINPAMAQTVKILAMFMAATPQ